MSRNHAVVVGASMSGLVAARVLSSRFDHVTIIDRDSLPAANENRRGVPQGRHGHGLLASGFGALKKLFPRLEQELLAAGAVPGDVIGDVRWFQQGFYKAKFQSGLAGIVLSRPLLEGTLRRTVRAQPNVTILDNTHVVGLATDEATQSVTGVRIQRADGAPAVVDAALVIDTSGRASRSPQWLEALGYPTPAEQTVEVDLGYTTRTFKRRPRDLNGDIGAVIGPKPPHHKRVGFMLAMEGDRWMVTIGGWLGDHAPIDARGFADFASTLTRHDIYEIIKDAEPLTEAVTYAFPSNLRRRYERLTRFPGRYLVMGDAMCSFNPFYGQGMSVAALEGLALDETLGEGHSPDTVWRPFFQAAARLIETPWTIAAGSDFAFPGVTGQKPVGTDLVNWHLARVHRVASSDRVLCRTFFDVANLLKPATTLFHPRVVARVTKGCLWSSASPQQMERPARDDDPRVSRRLPEVCVSSRLASKLALTRSARAKMLRWARADGRRSNHEVRRTDQSVSPACCLT
jgi:2-polyprenyl-6-methoxyphenol hydroxylase-like FAD-dependent oxidoreductase